MLASIKNYAIAFAVAVLIFGVTAFFLYPFINNNLLDGFSYETGIDTSENTADTQLPPPPSVTTPPEDKPGDDIEADSFTMMFVVSDYQPELFSDYRKDVPDGADLELLSQNNRHFKADICVIMRADKENGCFLFTALPNETRVSFKGISYCLGEIYEEYGITTYQSIVEATVGLKIDYYAEMQMSLFEDVIDTLGGVKFDVPEDMYYVIDDIKVPSVDTDAETEAPETDEYDEIIEDEPVLSDTAFVIDLKAGEQTLNGNEALQLLRFDDYIGPASTRATVAADFMEALADKYFKSNNISKLRSALNTIIKSSKGSSNLTLDDFDEISPLLEAYTDFAVENIIFPGSYSFDSDSNKIFISNQNSAYQTYSKYKAN